MQSPLLVRSMRCKSLAYIASIPVAAIHLVARGRTQDILHHAHAETSAF